MTAVRMASETGGVADDEGAQIEPLADPVDQSEGPEPGPSNAIGGGARDGEAGDTEQDEGKPVEEQDEVCLFRDEVCHLRCERLKRLLATPWHRFRYMGGGGLGTICCKYPASAASMCSQPSTGYYRAPGVSWKPGCVG